MCKLVFVNGQLSQALSDVGNLPAGVSLAVSRVDGDPCMRRDDEINRRDDEISQRDDIIISIAANTSFTLIEEYLSHDEIPAVYTTTMQTEIELGEGAKLNRVKIQKESLHATHHATTTIKQKKDSIADLVYYSIGSRSMKEQVTATLSETGAQCKTAGFYQLSHDAQHMDFNIQINHAASHTESDMLFKCVADKKSRGEFTGRIHVAKDAQKIKAHQANHNILLSNQAEVYSRPQLEIYADDVKCKHGSTTGELNQDALFYLRARGIEEMEAKKMLLEGFAEEILRRLPSPRPSPAAEVGGLDEQQLAGEGV